MAELRFTNELSQSDVGNVAGTLLRPRLWIPTEADYPGHGEWVLKTEAQLAEGQKRAMVAYQGLHMIGAVIYQRHPTRPGIVEMKNLSVTDDARGRYIGSFLLRNAEIEATSNDFPDCTTIVGDTKLTNLEMIKFVIKHGYTIQEVDDLYRLSVGLDAVFSKTVTN